MGYPSLRFNLFFTAMNFEGPEPTSVDRSYILKHPVRFSRFFFYQRKILPLQGGFFVMHNVCILYQKTFEAI